MRHGFSLPELVAVLAIAGILSSIAIPRLGRLRHSLAVDRAARQIAAAHQRARFAAIGPREAVVLTIDADSMVIRSKRAAALVWRDDGPFGEGVELVAPGRPVTFSPVGLAMGASNATYTVTQGEARRFVIVSRLGRVRIR